ncbi:hypothetical protein ASE76_03540 [Xylophilus sp. Leaf220]|nr:hypothetical protein ASE76_03540 [Xylophilus sp. Leaf220]
MRGSTSSRPTFLTHRLLLGHGLSEALRVVPTRQGRLPHDTKNEQPRIVPIHPRVALHARHFVAC